MDKTLCTINAVFSALAAYVLSKLGLLAPWWGMFLLLSAADILTGYTAAWVTGDNRSRILRAGIFRKFANIGMALVAGAIDWIVLAAAPVLGFSSVPLKGYVTLFALVFFILYELVSITENLKKTGATVPDFIVSILDMLRALLKAAVAPAAKKEKK